MKAFVYPDSAILHVVIGAVTGLVLLGAVLFAEPELTQFLISSVKKRLGKSD